jgi:hypothetical protein
MDTAEAASDDVFQRCGVDGSGGKKSVPRYQLIGEVVPGPGVVVDVGAVHRFYRAGVEELVPVRKDSFQKDLFCWGVRCAANRLQSSWIFMCSGAPAPSVGRERSVTC